MPQTTTQAESSKTVMLTVRMDEEIKKNFDSFCASVGMNASVAVNMFARAVLRERRIPFDIVDDPFYGKANQARLTEAMDDLEAGEGLVHKTMDELERMANE